MNLIVAQFVVTPEVRAENLTWLLDSTPAHVVLILFEPQFMYICLADMVRGVVGECGRFEGQWFDAGAVLSHKDRVKKADWLSSVHQEGDHYGSFRFEMIPGYMNPKAAIAVGVMYSDPAAEFSDVFLRDVVAAITDQRVRFLGGLFGCRYQQLPFWVRLLGRYQGG